MASNINQCFQAAVSAGRMSATRAREASARIDELTGKGLSETDAIAKVAEEMQDAAARHTRQTAARVKRTAEALARQQAHPAGPAAGTQALLARDLRGRDFGPNVEGRARAIRGLAHAGMVEVLDRYRAKFLGLWRDKAGLQEFVRGLYGESRAPEMQALTRAWSDTVERLRTRFEAAGGYLPQLQTWRLPQVWDGDAVRSAGRAEFVTYLEDALAAGRVVIRDLDTGEAVAGDRAKEIISQAWNRISTNGLSDLVPGQQTGQASLANSRSAARAFDWQSSEAWLDANRRFGAGDAGIFDLLTGHVDGMARDIAMLEILGPNPDWAMRYLTDVAKRADPPNASGAEAAITRTWDHVSGRASSPVSETLANFMDQVRAVLTSAQLGSAFLSSTSDLNSMRQAASWNGLSGARVLRNYLAQMNPANAADRALAVRGAIVAEAWVTRASGGVRFLADSQGVGIGTRVADLVMRVSLLSPHTQAGKNAFSLEFLGTLADQATRPLAQLDAPLQAALRRYGVTDAQWDTVRAHGLLTERGVSIISPDQVARSGAPDAVEAATRILEAVNAEARFAIPEPGAAERSLTLRGTRRGTIEGELIRSAMQYKSFPIAIMTTHLARGMDAARQGGDFGRYLASFMVGMTLMGAAAMQLKAISQGRDPRDMTDWKFWAAAFAQGGGGGLLGDFLFTSVSRADSSFYMNAVGGPIGGLVDDLARIGGMNIQALGDDQKERSFGGDLARFVRRNAPGTSLWYTRAAMDRMVWDQLQEMLDPDAARRFRQMERRAYRDFNQEFWWRPGESSPGRAPSAAPILGGTP
ncbi:hypothetical protein [Roseococcus thiosulfatophilus]|uniref:hypothetical protein n=1 Tax=Roseococcus thiosulfatophilus TaxID=35813 RepID=UPI001A902087|nr:hypothetical protein [Roseococcus thiosulfatophilus]